MTGRRQDIRAALLEKFEFQNYGHALESLSEAFPDAWGEIQDCLEKLSIWMGKLAYRLRSRRNGGCPILAVGIRKPCIEGY